MGGENAWVICILFLSLVSSSNSLAVEVLLLHKYTQHLLLLRLKIKKINMIPKDNTLLLAEEILFLPTSKSI